VTFRNLQNSHHELPPSKSRFLSSAALRRLQAASKCAWPFSIFLGHVIPALLRIGSGAAGVRTASCRVQTWPANHCTQIAKGLKSHAWTHRPLPYLDKCQAYVRHSPAFYREVWCHFCCCDDSVTLCFQEESTSSLRIWFATSALASNFSLHVAFYFGQVHRARGRDRSKVAENPNSA
jgi:hypothetical protein